MKLVLQNREKLQALGSFLVDEFDNLIARIRGAWNIEHTEEGAHGHVHATSVASGRITFSTIAEDTITATQVDNYTPAGFDTAAMLRLNASSTTPISITGLKVPQDTAGAVLDGRMLVIENVSTSTTFVIESESTYSVPRNRFRTSHQADPLDEAAPARLYLPPVSLLMLTYNAALARWIVHSRNTDDNTRLLEQATGAYNDLSVANWLSLHTLRLSFTGASASISGFDSTGIPETHRKTLVNAGLYAVDILHQNTGSLAANRVVCPGGVRYRLHPREACALMRTLDGWRIVEKADQWIDVTFDTGTFTASSGNWTLASGDQTTLTYQFDGNKMTVSFELDTTTVSATPTELRIAIPLSRIAARKMSAPLSSAVDNGTALDTGRAEVVAGGTYISIYKNASNTAWAASANLTSVRGQLTFMVRDDSASISESHTDTSHGDTAHADADHIDVTHVDDAHADEHFDSAHSDASHGDIAFADTAHADVTHADVAHVDVAHSDVAHSDSTPTHGDTPHADHSDLGAAEEHADTEHGDTPHSDVAFSDTAHADTAHVDTPHSDTAHSDTAHSDTGHVDTAHSDGHNDTPHADTAHVDTGHGDTAHADTPHEDVGYHTDTTHADV
jgi:hypothetical protein